MSNRVVHVPSLVMEHEPVPADQSISGSPTTGTQTLDEPTIWEVGVWEHSVGTSTDIEADEVFVVISGRATVECDDGAVLSIGPGDVGFLQAGTATTWTVHETLRKVYVAPNPQDTA